MTFSFQMFLICLPPSMRKAVGTKNDKTGVAMVRASDALWDALGGHNPTFIFIQHI
jgi:hypothetical protein